MALVTRVASTRSLMLRRAALAALSIMFHNSPAAAEVPRRALMAGAAPVLVVLLGSCLGRHEKQAALGCLEAMPGAVEALPPVVRLLLKVQCIEGTTKPTFEVPWP